MTALAVLAAALGGWLLVGVPAPRERPPQPPDGRSILGRRGAVLVAVGSAAVLLLTARGTVLALGLIVTATALAGARLVAGVRLRAAADRTADRVVEACEALAGELRAGQPPSAALSHCAEVWPALEPVVVADGLGSDVPQALRRLARSPGAAGLREVASAWQVSVGSGAAMSSALTLVADSARERRATQRLVQAELASAQATARLVAVLPVVALVMGAGVGGDPWGFLLRTPAGLGCLGAGLALAYAGLWWMERIATAAVHR